jgi:hypothetical protein
MASKKYKSFLLGILILIGSGVFAQKSTSVYDPYDSAVITPKGLPQQNEFWNHNYDFPAKPRNQWEIGASLSSIGVNGDVASKYPVLPSFEVHVRKAIGYVFSLRLQFLSGFAEGLNWLPSENYKFNSAWYSSNPNGKTNAGIPIYHAAGTGSSTVDEVFYNYRTEFRDLGLQGIITLNNIRFHKQKTGILIYAGGGIGATLYQAKVNAGNESTGQNYSQLFQAIFQKQASAGFQYVDRSTILGYLKNGITDPTTGTHIAGMDNTYESAAESESGRYPHIGSFTLKPSGTILFGVAYKLSTRINLQLEDRETFVKSDLLDGQRWQENPPGTPVLTGDYDAYNALSLGVNFNLGAKAVEPLWWLNPLDYAYSELNNPRHINFPKPKFNDSDGDGVIDELDREPNTPAGCPVDTHGVSLDTDGDGVPDCKDKQKITPTECQPVDADGVGKCPDPACCKAVMDSLSKIHQAPACPADYPSVSFKGNGIGLSGDAKALLATVASKMKENPACNIIIVGYPAASKPHQSLADKRLDAIKKYLVETLGISTDRITTDKKIGGGEENTYDIKSN